MYWVRGEVTTRHPLRPFHARQDALTPETSLCKATTSQWEEGTPTSFLCQPIVSHLRWTKDGWGKAFDAADFKLSPEPVTAMLPD